MFCGVCVVISGVAITSVLLKSIPYFLAGWWPKWLQWSPTSAEALEAAERKVFSYLKCPFNLRFVKIPSWEKGGMIDIQTLSMNTKNSKTPLVMIHGYASGIGMFVLNFDSLSENRPLYAFDIPGFGRSSRASFSNDSVEVEKQLIEIIESWRKQVGLKKFILLGHSFGGYLASSYAFQYPERVKHLILADPWGIPELEESKKKFALSFHGRMLFIIGSPVYPIGALRVAGPLGFQVVKIFRPELKEMFSPTIKDPEVALNYIYHINAQTPSGEKAFNTMTVGYGWVKKPMLPKLINLPSEIPITIIYGSDSFIDHRSGLIVKEARKDSFVDVKLIHGAGHNLYADKPEEFNFIVNTVCESIDTEPDSALSL